MNVAESLLASEERGLRIGENPWSEQCVSARVGVLRHGHLENRTPSSADGDGEAA